jgi:hypothetical protein
MAYAPSLVGTVRGVPATFPSHAGVVLPLKLWRPRWFDGVALVVGSALPDLVYVGGCCGPLSTAGHRWWGVVFGVPVTVLLAAIIRRAAPLSSHTCHRWGRSRCGTTRF